MIDRCLSTLATAWIITFVVTTGLVAGLAVASLWDSAVYAQGLQGIVTTNTSLVEVLRMNPNYGSGADC